MPTGSPLLDDYNQTGIVSPGLQEALDRTRKSLAAMQPMAGISAPALPPATQQQPATPSLTSPAQAPTLSPHLQELNRLTAPPQQGPLAHTSADTGQSGIDQIHSPWLRTPLKVLDAIGTMFAPTLDMALPGTQLHHNLLTKWAAGDVANDQKQQKSQDESQQSAATVAREGAQTGLAGAQANEANARADSLRNPQDKYASSSGGIFDTHTGKITTTAPPTNAFEAWRQQNPDKPVGDWLKASGEAKPTEYEDFREGYLKSHPAATTDEIASAYSSATQKNPQNEYEDFKGGYVKTHPQADAFEIAREYAKAHQAPRQAPQSMMFVPDGNGGYTAQLVHPGQSIGPGAVSSSGVNTQNTPTTQQRNVASQASLVNEQTPYMLSEIDRLKDKLGPVSGRWNEFMQGKVGTDDPDMAGLRADLLMYSSAVALMHARGRLPENLREEFDQAINAPKQSADNLKAVLTKIGGWTKANMNTINGGQNGGGQGAAKVGDIKKFSNGKTGKWDGTGWVAQ